MKQIIKVTKGKTVQEMIKHDQPGQQVFVDSVTGKVLKVLTVCGESKTDQAFAQSHDINNLLAAAQAKGLLRATKKFEGEMDDFPAYNFQEAQNMMAKANSMFEEMPAGIRAKFKDPAKFMDFVNNPANRAELETMGFSNGFDNLDHRGQIINPNYNVGVNAGVNTDGDTSTTATQEAEATQ